MVGKMHVAGCVCGGGGGDGNYMPFGWYYNFGHKYSRKIIFFLKKKNHFSECKSTDNLKKISGRGRLFRDPRLCLSNANKATIQTEFFIEKKLQRMNNTSFNCLIGADITSITTTALRFSEMSIQSLKKRT